MKKGEQINILGQVFTCKGSIKSTQIYRGLDLFSCYDRPSEYKIAIYNSWKRWSIDVNGWLDIASYNCMMFTLKGVVETPSGKMYVYITKTRQECYNIEEE